MMPRKKLDFYASKHGVENFAAVKLTEEQIAAICEKLGTRQYGMSDCGGRLSNLIDRIIDDAQFQASVRERMTAGGKQVQEDFISIRIADYAADDVMAAYAAIIDK